MSQQHPPSIEDIQEAALRIAPFVHHTPVVSCQAINERLGAEVFFKCENLQKVGAFKYRGATNAVRSLSEEDASRGVVTHSSGNHAQALALAAKMRGITAYIVMPENAPKVKKAAVAGYDGRIVYCRPTLEAREEECQKVIEKTGATLVHSYSDERVIAGQGTAALEFLEEVSGLDIMMAPVGGGGLISGTAICSKAMSPETEVIAAEPEGADDAYRSFKDGVLHPSLTPNTIADGLLTSLSELTCGIIEQHVDDIVTTSEDAIIEAMRFIWERAKLVVEPSSAVPLAALFENKLNVQEKRVGIILSGGNVDLQKLPWKQF